MAIADQLTLLNTTKNNIKDAIEAKGVTVGSVPFADYPSKIALIEGGGGGPTPPIIEPTAWVRPNIWPTVSIASGDNKLVGLYAVWPYSSNYFAATVTGQHTIDFGDGTINNYVNTSSYNFDYNSSALTGSDAPVTIVSADSTINRTAHGFTNGQTVNFYNITGNTEIVEDQLYYVVNATVNTFQVSTTNGGLPITLTVDGTATLLPYKIAVITITPQSGQNINSVNFLQRNPIKTTTYDTGWLEISIALPFLSSLIIGSTTTTPLVQNNILKSVRLLQTSSSLNLNSTFANLRSLENVDFDSTVLPTSMNSTFNNCTALQIAPTIDLSNCTNVTSMFQNCANLKTIPAYDLSNVSNMQSMFDGCSNLQVVPTFNLTGTVSKTMNSMFSSCNSLIEVPLFDTSRVTNMNYMFSSCNSLIEVPLFDTSNVTLMQGMFFGCASLVTIPQFDTSKVTNMSSMFQNSFSLKEVPFLNTSNVTNMQSMFNGCRSLKTIPRFDMSKVTLVANMFSDCRALESIPDLNLAVCTSMQEMFRYCHNLKKVEMINMPNNTNMQGMFEQCTSLTRIPDFNTIKVTNFDSAFNDCWALREIPDLYMNAPTSSSGYSSIFSGCRTLSRIKAKEFRWTFSVASCMLGAAELNEIYTNLPTVTGQTITVSGNPGVAADDPTIATAKGWTVSG